MIVEYRDRALRVALVEGTAVKADATLETTQALIVGRGGALDDGEPWTILEPTRCGYRLELADDLSGAVWLSGVRRDVRELRGEIAIGPDDYGVVRRGGRTVFFQLAPVREEVPQRAGNYAIPAAALVLIALCVPAGRSSAPIERPRVVRAIERRTEHRARERSTRSARAYRERPRVRRACQGWVREPILRSLRAREGALLACFPDPEPVGRIDVEVQLGARGRAQMARVIRSSFPPAIDRCVLDLLLTTRFPANTAGLRFRMPFVFQGAT